MINENRLRTWVLPLAIGLGLFFHNQLFSYYFVTPYLLFGMMFFTCSKISVSNIKFKPIHFWLLMAQIVGGCTIYFMVRGYNEAVAQGLMMCVFTPVALASPVVGGLLGGNITLMTTYVLISNVIAAVLAPILFSIIGANSGYPIISSFIHIIQRTTFLLIVPMLISLLMRRFTPKTHKVVLKMGPASFYLWALCMMVLIGSTFHSLFSQTGSTKKHEIIMVLGALLLCILQFFFGKKLGIRYGDMVAGRQLMGQKNTGIGIWLTISFLDPLASVAPAAYIIWQNIMNSVEIWRGSSKR
ncbi:MAG TPA: transporter [Bacteroidaceae bacterium]|nr:transporter [Bacteroidaceae bacterium]